MSRDPGSGDPTPKPVLDLGRLEQILPGASEILRTQFNFFDLGRQLQSPSWSRRPGITPLAVDTFRAYLGELVMGKVEKVEGTIEELIQYIIKREKEQSDIRANIRLFERIIHILLKSSFAVWANLAAGTSAYRGVNTALESEPDKARFEGVQDYLRYKLEREIMDQTFRAATGNT